VSIKITIASRGKKNETRNRQSTLRVSCLVLAELAVLVLLLTLLLECDDDEADEYVDHEERDDDDVDEVEDGDLHAVVVNGANTLAVRVNTRVHQTKNRQP